MIRSPDISYNVIVIGLWSWAEMTTGVIISCLPAMPRFFQHVGPKVYSAFYGEPILPSGSKSDPRSTQGQTKNFQRALSKPKGSDIYSSQNHRKDEYVALSELDMAPLREDRTSDWLPTQNNGIVTSRDELEKGRCTR